MKIKTKYQVKDQTLFYDGKPTEVIMKGKYFYFKDQPMDLFQDDRQVFIVKPIVPFLKKLRISTPLDLYVDSEGIIWGDKPECIFDKYIQKNETFKN